MPWWTPAGASKSFLAGLVLESEALIHEAVFL